MATTVRPASGDDAVAVQSIYAPIVRDTWISFEIDVPGVGEMRRRILETTELLPWLVAHADDEVVGYAYAARHSERGAYAWSVDTSVYIAAECRGKGVGRFLYNRLLAVLIDLGYVMAYAGIALPNPASVALHEAVDFRRVGVLSDVGFKLGRWCDVEWWSRPLIQPPKRPLMPRPWRGET